MKTLLLALVALPATALAQTPFDGAWRMNLENTQYVGTEKYSVQNGTFTCDSCDPRVNVKADGADHPVSGSPYFDTASVRLVDDRAVEISYRKQGEPYATIELAATADGKTLNTEFTNRTEGGQQVSGKYSSTRIGARPAAAHGISGEWQPGKLASISENVLEVTYSTDGDRFTMTDKAGNSTAPDSTAGTTRSRGMLGSRLSRFAGSTRTPSKKRTSGTARSSASAG